MRSGITSCATATATTPTLAVGTTQAATGSAIGTACGPTPLGHGVCGASGSSTGSS